MGALTVACVNVNDYLGRGQEYVDKLRRACERHVPEHEFVCITESPYSGFWAKLSLFEPGRFTGDVLYLDLDVVLSGDLAHLVSLLETHDFWALDDFAWPRSKADQWAALPKAFYPPGMADMYVQLGHAWGTINSSVMLWDREAGREAWERYTPEAAKGMHGDQNWLNHWFGDRIQTIPEGWAGSYKYGPPGCPITVFHGEPKPHEVPHDPVVREHWT